MDRIRRLIRKAQRNVRHHGLLKTLQAIFLRYAGYPGWLTILRGHYVEEADPGFLAVPRGYTAGFLAPQAIGELAREPEAGMAEEFVRLALWKDDKCFGFTRDGKLRAYGWYSNKPTRVPPDLSLHFSRDYVYMYKGFTHDAHRGKRLFPIGMTRALKHYRAVGYKGMLLYVDAHNLDSLKSCARMGFRRFGSIYVARILGRYFVYESPGCARFGFRIEPAPVAGHPQPGRAASADRRGSG